MVLAATRQEVSDGFNQNLDGSSEKPESSRNILAAQEAQQAGEEASTLQEDGESVKLRVHLEVND